MRRFFAWALFSALFGCCGTASADPGDIATISGGDVVYDISVPYEPIMEESDFNPVCDRCGDPCQGSFVDNTLIFAGADVYKSLGDRITNINGGVGGLTNSFGGVVGFNTGFALGDSKLRGQIGASYGAYDFKGRMTLVPEDRDVEEQEFITAGIYKRGDMQLEDDPLSYGVVVDAFYAENWGVNSNAISLGQIRGIVGYALNKRSEIGSFATFNVWDDRAAVTVAGAPGVQTTIRAANQVNAYYRYNTSFGGSLMGYVGGFDDRDIQSWQFGLNGTAPLSHYAALYGNFVYAAPNSRTGPRGSGEEQFAIQFGLVYYLGGKSVSKTVTGQRGLPLLDVANNGSFLVTD